MTSVLRKGKQTPSFALYRHLAIGVVGITFIVAVVMEEKRADTSAAEHAKELTSEAGHAARDRLPARAERHGGSSATPSGFGAPMDMRAARASTSSSLNGVALGPLQYVPEQYMSDDVDRATGLSISELNQLPAAEREELLRRVRASRLGTSPKERKRQIAAIEARAKARARQQ